MQRAILLLGCLTAATVLASPVQSADEQTWPAVKQVDAQPLLAQVKRLSDALDYLGSPLSDAKKKELRELANEKDAAKVTARVQAILDELCIAAVDIPKEGKIAVIASPKPPELVEQGWRSVLVKVRNNGENTRRLQVDSPNGRPLPRSPKDQVESRWLSLAMFDGQPLTPNLSGLELEYRVLDLWSLAAGEKSAQFEFSAGGKGRNTSLIREWRFDKGADGWKAMNQAKVTVEKGCLNIEGTGNDPYIGADVEAEGGEMVLRFWAETDQPGNGQLFWWTKEKAQTDGARQVNFPLQPGKPALYEVSFKVEGKLAGLRLDPNGRVCKMRIDWIDLSYRPKKGEEWVGTTLKLKTAPSTVVSFKVVDDEGKPTMGCFEIRDEKGRIYPAQPKRLAPDLFFQRQIYRETGELIRLPAGKYTVICSRGPESIYETKTLTVVDKPLTLSYEAKRWVDPAKEGWWSGDHHIHAAGCAHYDSPTEGVQPIDMMRQCMGEDLKVGCCLTWGPCFDYQKRFFSAKTDPVSWPPYLLRYDVEVSGFGSHQSGHINLLRLKQQIPPGGDSKNHWPTLGLNTLRWAKKQGAVCGPAHSASGLTRTVGKVEGGKEGPNRLPNFDIPAYDGIGANEFIVDVPHEVMGPDDKMIPAVDFISTMNTDRRAEFNMWYHVLNCGFRVRASGETDFPCVSGERVGLGRVYAKVDGKLEFEKWCDSIANGRSYVSDGRTHLLDFEAKEGKQKVEMGSAGSEMQLKGEAEVTFTVRVAGMYADKRKLPVELVVNGYPVDKKEIDSDGKMQELTFKTTLKRSSWVAVRVFPSGHTNPIFVIVDGKPIRASKASAEWCLKGVDQCWAQKKGTYRKEEQKDAEAAYDHARKVYKRLMEESPE